MARRGFARVQDGPYDARQRLTSAPPAGRILVAMLANPEVVALQPARRSSWRRRARHRVDRTTRLCRDLPRGRLRPDGHRHLGARHRDDVPEAQRLHPNEPWLWRKEWAQGRIADGSKAGVIGMWVFAILWGGISGPIAWMVLHSEQQNKGAWFVLLFPLIGVGLLIAAVYQTLRHLKYGTSFLVLSMMPGVIGRNLRGTIETSFREAPPTVSLRLSAVRRVTTGSGKSRSTTEHPVWQDAAEIDAGSLPMGLKGFNIPVSFEIPADAPETDSRDTNNQLLWRVEASAAVPGVDYSARFEVPVFKTGADPLSEEEIAAARERRRAQARSYAPLEPKVVISSTARGGTEFLFPPRRKMGSMIGGFAFLIVFFAFVAGMLRFGVPTAIPAFFGLFGAVMLAALLGSLFYTARVIVEPPTITFRHSVLRFGVSSRLLQIADVKDVAARISGEGKAASWELKVNTNDGNSFSAAALIPEQREAEWAAEKLRQAIGL